MSRIKMKSDINAFNSNGVDIIIIIFIYVVIKQNNMYDVL